MSTIIKVDTEHSQGHVTEVHHPEDLELCLFHRDARADGAVVYYRQGFGCPLCGESSRVDDAVQDARSALRSELEDKLEEMRDDAANLRLMLREVMNRVQLSRPCIDTASSSVLDNIMSGIDEDWLDRYDERNRGCLSVGPGASSVHTNPSEKLYHRFR